MKQAEQEHSVGVVIRTRDRPAFLARALASVQAQEYRNWHIALVNDGGAPGPVDALLTEDACEAPVPAAKITVLHMDPGVGRAAAFNTGLAALDTDFVTCLDDDDTWAPAFMAALLDFWAETAPAMPSLGGVAAQVSAVTEELVDEPGGTGIRVIGEESLPNAFSRKDFLLRPLAYGTYRQDIYPVQWMLRRAPVAEVGGFPESFDVMEDRAFMNRFLARWDVAMLDRRLARHHRRVDRRADTGRSVLLNTLDNPSYDWRRFADLARPPGRGAGADALPRLLCDLLGEMNYETSALWHKIDGEAATLRNRLAAIEARLAPGVVETEAPAQREGGDRVIYDLWTDQAGLEQGHAITPGTAFAGRFVLSHGTDRPGTLCHLSASGRRLTVQLPDTGVFAAIEFDLAGLIPADTGLRWHLEIIPPAAVLFETALSLWEGGEGAERRHRFEDTWVHSAAPGRITRIERCFSVAQLRQGSGHRLSVILPRQARNFHFCCTGFVLEPA
ncbi:MAG: glycosyltransferase [Rhodobacteraceae bacterium]|nr:glycosyltransferase [Paracoccaceae bacterium]